MHLIAQTTHLIIVWPMKNFMLFIASVVTALLPEPAFTQNSEKNPQASATPCSLPSQASTVKVYKPRLLPGNSENASVLEVDDKKIRLGVLPGILLLVTAMPPSRALAEK